MRRWPGALRALILLVVAGSCGPREVASERPLLDGRHEPEVLVEGTGLARPPAIDANRFLKGWLPWAGKNRLIGMVPRVEGAWLEFVHLVARPRHLLLRSDLTRIEEAPEVALDHEGREVDRRPLAERTRLELPTGLPVGRVRMRLRFSHTDGIGFRGARVLPTLPEGEVRFLEGAVAQAPWSAIDFVQDYPPGSLLLGSFQPPRARGTDQGFAIELEGRGSEPTRMFEWTGGAPLEVRVPIPEGDGPVRVRLLAYGEGEPGRWDDLRVAFSVPPEPAPVEPPTPPRLVVLYMFDALRADYVGHLGGPEGISPTLDRLATEGVTFRRHISNAPNTKPSIKSLFVGRPFLIRGHDSLPSNGPPTLADSYTAAGYRSMAFSGSPWVGSGFGTDRGFEHRSAKAEYRPGGAAAYNDSAERVHAAALEGLAALEDDDRAFFYLHTMHPHNPFRVPEPFEARFTRGLESTIDGATETLMAIRQGRVETTEADEARLRGLYAAGLAYNDAELAKLLEELESRYRPGEVLLVLTSDHGEELFDHDGVLHGYTLYREQLEIPLIFWWPGVLEPGRIDELTDHLDLSATLRSLVDPQARFEHGRPLWDLLLEGESRVARDVRFAAASSVAGGIFVAETADLRFIWAPRQGNGWGMGRGRGRDHDAVYLFDHRRDPRETENLAGEGGLEEQWLRARLLAWIERGKLQELGADGEEQIDPETERRLRALGYVE